MSGENKSLQVRESEEEGKWRVEVDKDGGGNGRQAAESIGNSGRSVVDDGIDGIDG